MIVYLGSDHAGYHLKKKILKFLKKEGLKYKDLGPFSYERRDDYPDYAQKVARKVAKDGEARGVLICDTGMGMAIAANKIRGARAAFGFSNYAVKKAREDNDANILTFSGDKQSPEKVLKIVRIFLKTPFSEKERHRRRIEKIKRLEN